MMEVVSKQSLLWISILIPMRCKPIAGCANGELIKWSAGVPSCSTDLAGIGDIMDGGNGTGATVSVGTKDAQSFGLKTNNVTKMTILANGNVGIGTNAPTVMLDVSGGVRAGSSTVVSNCGSGPSAGEGTQRYNYTTHFMEYCDGTAWVALPKVQSSVPITTPAGSGYFVLSGTAFAGNTLGTVTTADAKCLTELQTTNTSWMGYATANANGQLVAGKVHALLCDNAVCNSLIPLGKYYFANAADAASGGAYFTADASGQGPGDTAIWSAANYFNSSSLIWSGRAGGSSTTWGTTNGGNCNNWSENWNSSVVGSLSDSASGRWSFTGRSCGEFHQMICFVNP